MKRLIYSIYREEVDEHPSAPSYKQVQFRKYKQQLEKVQREYAEMCGADYILFGTDNSNYVDIQFEKLFRLEELIEDYDEVMYIDFDVVPQTKANFFEVHDLNTICATSINRTPDKEILVETMKKDGFNHMNMYCKGCAKQSMLQLDGINAEPTIINTGVVAGNKHSIGLLKLRERLADIDALLEEAKEDNVFPEEIYKHWARNNEIFFSYLIERYNIPFTNIGLTWNFFLCRMYPEHTSAAHFLHHSNKEFERSFPDVADT